MTLTAPCFALATVLLSTKVVLMHTPSSLPKLRFADEPEETTPVASPSAPAVASATATTATERETPSAVAPIAPTAAEVEEVADSAHSATAATTMVPDTENLTTSAEPRRTSAFAELLQRIRQALTLCFRSVRRVNVPFLRPLSNTAGVAGAGPTSATDSAVEAERATAPTTLAVKPVDPLDEHRVERISPADAESAGEPEGAAAASELQDTRELPAMVVYQAAVATEELPVPVAREESPADAILALYELEPDDLPSDGRDHGGDWAHAMLHRDVEPIERTKLLRRLVTLQRSQSVLVRAITEDTAIRRDTLALIAERLPSGPEIYAAVALTCDDVDIVADREGNIDPERSHPAIHIAGALVQAGRRDEFLAMIVNARRLSQILFGFALAGSEDLAPLLPDEQAGLLAGLQPEDAAVLDSLGGALSGATEPVEA